MQIIKTDFKKGFARIQVEHADDLWYLSHLIDPGDIIKGSTTRKIKIGDSENAKVVKKKVTLSIEAEKIEYVPEKNQLRINGKILEGPEDFPKGSYQNISLEEGNECSIQKPTWLKYQKEKLKEASEKSYAYLICLLDREEALFALSKKFGFEILAKTKSDLPKKGDENSKGGNFYTDLAKGIETYALRHEPEQIIIASPAFYKDQLYKKIKDDDIKKKTTLAVCSSISQNALEEVMRRPELKEVLKQSRNREEILVVEELLAEIGKDGLCSYGKEEVKNAIQAGAVAKLLLSDKFIKDAREKQSYDQVDEALKLVDTLKGDIHIISSEHDAGKKLDGLGGIAAITRYKL